MLAAAGGSEGEPEHQHAASLCTSSKHGSLLYMGGISQCSAFLETQEEATGLFDLDLEVPDSPDEGLGSTSWWREWQGHTVEAHWGIGKVITITSGK